MNKELEESYKHFKNILDKASLFTMPTYTYIHLEKLLNYIENSIPKSVVEEKIEEYKNVIDECREDEEHCGEIPIYEHDIKILQELLKEKGEK